MILLRSDTAQSALRRLPSRFNTKLLGDPPQRRCRRALDVFQCLLRWYIANAVSGFHWNDSTAGFGCGCSAGRPTQEPMAMIGIRCSKPSCRANTDAVRPTVARDSSTRKGSRSTRAPRSRRNWAHHLPSAPALPDQGYPLAAVRAASTSPSPRLPSIPPATRRNRSSTPRNRPWSPHPAKRHREKNETHAGEERRTQLPRR